MTKQFKIKGALQAVLGAFFVLCAIPFYANGAEEIQRFTVDITPRADGSFTVVETISYDFGSAERHGIFREIPTSHPQGDRNFLVKRHLNLSLESVTKDGNPVPYTSEESGDALYLKIGDPYTTITGVHTYRIAYTVEGGFSYFDNGHTELYWDAIAPEWQTPIREARIMLHDPDGVFDEEFSCYVGASGGSDLCEFILTEDGGKTIIVSGLRAYEGVTIAKELRSEAVAQVILEEKRVVFFWIPGLLIWFSLLSIFVYRYRTEYKVDKTTIAQYEPYEDFKPMYTGLLFDGRLDPRDITAGIVYLAEQGYLKIRKVDTKVMFFFDVDDYEIILLKPIVHISSAFQRELLRLLFGTAPVVGNKVSLQKLKHDTTKQRANNKILMNLKKDLEKDLKDSGFFEVHVSTSMLLGGVVGLGIFLWIVGGIIAPLLGAHVFFIVVGIVGSLIILLFAYRRRTTKGYEALWHLKGFKEFLSVTETERYKFHNAPEKSSEQFMEYLPYAIAFGVEKEWAEVFKDITLPNPEWYDGAGTHFSAISFTNSIGSFGTALASSGSSASGGGGSVGGGGGGGGGGSW